MVFFQHKSIVVGAIKNVTLRRILLVLVFCPTSSRQLICLNAALIKFP